MSFIQITTILDENLVESFSEFLQENGALSLTLQDAADEPLYQEQLQETPLWKKTKIVALFSPEIPIDTLFLLIKRDFPSVELSNTFIEDQDWVAITQNSFQPQHYGKNLWILPSWHDEKSYTGIHVKIDPGLAFGTGTHPTTALCLEWLAEHPPKNLTVIDYGCGSGILSLACLALGAKQVIAVDHDTQALTATKNNAELNPFVNQNNLQVCLPDEQFPQVDLILANILANPLIQLAPRLQGLLRKNGTLVLSGFFSADVERVFGAYEKEMEIVSMMTKEQWSRVVLKFKRQG